MRFSVFLEILCQNRVKTIKKKEDYVRGLFESTGIGFYYGDDYAKKLANPSSAGRPLSDDFRENYKKGFPLCNVQKFFSNSLNKIRLIDLMEAFKIDKDEKKDFDILTEALAIYFEAYIQIGENENLPEFNNVYSILLDQHGNGNIYQANENALLSAKEAYYSAINNLLKISRHEADLLELKGPFENYFADINKVFRNFEAKCNREGRTIFKLAKDKALSLTFVEENDFDINNYLELISVPGSIPIELQKKIKFIVYDNLKFKDKSAELIVNLYDDFDANKKIDLLSSIDFNGANEAHFTEFISFNIEGSERNLLEDSLYILYRIDILLNTLDQQFKKTKKLDAINKKIDQLYEIIHFGRVSFCQDGIFFPNENKTKYFIPCGIILRDERGRHYEAGEHKQKYEDIWFIHESIRRKVDLTSNNTYFLNTLQLFFKLECQIYKQTKYDSFLSEIVTVNKDGTARHYIFSVDCKAKYYRTIRKIASRVYADNTTSFYSQAIMVSNLASHITKEMTSEDRISVGTDILCCFGFNVNECYSFEATKEQIEKNEYTFRENPIIPALGPLMANIIANVKHRDELDKKFGKQ